MRDYGSYERRRRAAQRRRNGSRPTALFVGLGVFALAVLMVGVALLRGGNKDQQATATAAAVVTVAPSPTIRLIAPSPSPTIQQLAQAPTSVAPTSTVEEAIEPTATDETELDSPTEEVDTSEVADDPTLTPDEEVEPTATTEPSQPTVEPAAGDFGTLPPADMPSGGNGREIVLDYQVGIGAGDVPSEAQVYQLVWPERTADAAAALASSLGISGDVTGGNGVYRVEDSSGSVSIAGESVQYLRQAAAPTGALEDNDTLTASARDWLLSNGLVLDDIGPGSVTSRDDAAGRASIVFYSTDPETLLSVYPSARVTIGPGSTVLEAYVIWPGGYESSTYGLRSLDDMLNDLYDGKAYIEADLSSVPGDGQVIGTMTITSASLAYSTAGTVATGQFLTPVVVLSGDAVLSDSGMTIPISIYVPAVSAQDVPRG